MVFKRKTYGYADMVSLSFRTSWFYTSIFGLNSVIRALIPTAMIFVTAAFIDTAILVFQGERLASAVYLPMGLLAGLWLYDRVMAVVLSLLEANRLIYYRKKLVPEMVAYRTSLAYKHMEHPDTWDLIHRVFPFIENRIWNIYGQVREALFLVLMVAGVVATLFTQVWWLALTMVLLAVPVVMIGSRAGKDSYQANRDMTEIDRVQWNLSWILIDRENVEERSVYRYSSELNKQYIDKFEYARKYRLRISIKNALREQMFGVATLVYAIVAMVVLLPQVYQGYLSLGMYIALVSAVLQLINHLSFGVNQMVVQLTGHREWLRDLSAFLALDQIADANALPERGVNFKTIEFKDVSFSYPNTDKLILKNASFTIEKGLHYAFVGENGAGKTTITKLLTGMYDNYTGEILVDGVELRQYSHGKLKGLTSVVYQDFARYFMTVYDNVAVGDVHEFENTEQIERAIEQVGLSDMVAGLRDGIHTPLGKMIRDGVDISGGQWQRIAMARNIVNKAPLKILDEPTSALDPVAESELYKSFEQMTKGQTTIFISHRLGSTKLADIIYVLDQGAIKEQGTHEALIDMHGIYAEMYQAQAQWFAVDEATEEGGAH